MFRKMSPLGGLLALTACFPGLEQYGECADGACGGDVPVSASTENGTGSRSTAAGNPASSNGSSSDGGGGPGGEGPGGDGPGPGGSSTGSTASSSSDATSSSSGGGADPCLVPAARPEVKPGALVEGEGFRFCIDQAEVTHESYRAFYDDVAERGYDIAGFLVDKPQCDWKTDTTPEGLVPDFAEIQSQDWANTTHGELPMVSIDWCAAATYCDWAGKRLCGGTNGSAIGWKEQQPKNEWFIACSHDNQRNFAYNVDDADHHDPLTCINGSPSEATCPSYDRTACASDGECSGWTGTWDTADAIQNGCQAFDPRIVNLNGNVAEWVDACSPEQLPGFPSPISGHLCETRGGSCPSETYTVCAWAGRHDEDDAGLRSANTGFRCCWDAPEGG